MKDKWQEDIRHRLGSYEKDAPEGLWENIQRNMPKVVPPCEETPRHTRFTLSVWYRAASVAVAASVVLFLGYYIHQTRSEGDSYRPNPTAIVNTPTGSKVSSGQTNPTYIVPHTVSRPPASPVSLQPHATATLPSGKVVACETDGDSSSTKTTPVSTVLAAATSGKTDSVSRKIKEEYTSTQIHVPHTQTAYNGYRQHDSHHEGSRWTVSSGAMGALGSSQTVYSRGDALTSVGPDDVDWKDNPMLGIGIFNQGKKVTTEMKHKLPVRVGLNVAYALTERLSVESGFVYTHLSSDMRDGTAANYYSGTQQLDYVGIPIQVRYKFLNFRCGNIYASSGILAEQCVAGRVTKDYVIASEPVKSEREDIHSKPLQVSAQVSLGAQFGVADRVGFYIEPGLSYAFDDHSSLSTIYKDKPLNFNINIGLRYTLDH